MSVLVYKILHVLGVLFVFTALGGLLLRAWGGDTGRGGVSRWAGMGHGIGLLLILVSGFGMLAKLGYGFELWVWLKLVLWIFFGAVVVLIRRRPAWAPVLWWTLPILGGVATYLALYKPGA